MNLVSMLFKAAEEGGAAQTPHSWLPENFEIIWGGLAFVVVASLLYKFAFPPLKKGLTARSERIAKELMQASNNRVSADHSAAVVRGDLGDIEAERTRLLAAADQDAARVIEEGRARIRAEAADLEARAKTDIASGGSRLVGELQGQVASIAIAATEHVVVGSLDPATHTRLIDDVIAKIGANRP